MNENQLLYFICCEMRAYAVTLGKTPPEVRMGNENQLLYTLLQILKAMNA